MDKVKIIYSKKIHFQNLQVVINYQKSAIYKDLLKFLIL